MTVCSIENLLKLLNKQLDLDGKLAVLDHLDMCEICRDMVYQISRNRDRALFVYKPYIDEGEVA